MLSVFFVNDVVCLVMVPFLGALVVVDRLACDLSLFSPLTTIECSPSIGGRSSSAEEPRMALKVGEMAPDFEVPAVVGDKRQKVKLSDFKGKKHVVLAFYPLDWTPV